MKLSTLSKFGLALALAAGSFACGPASPPAQSPASTMNDASLGGPHQPRPYSTLRHPEWAKNLAIYEVNIRQYTPEGTFAALEQHLPRLKELGVGILWLMPINPIGQQFRKGSLGSYYSISDYTAINPEYGDMDDFRRLVDKIHELGMYVIVDWVANHTSWDHPWAIEHPEWYQKDTRGRMIPPRGTDWADVITLDYSQPGLRQAMAEAMEFWVREADIDGYRCDVAGFVPLDFWDDTRAQLDSIKPVFMLAEWESRDLHQRAFDLSCAWKTYDALHDLARGRMTVPAFSYHFAEVGNSFPPDGIRMLFVDNHDKNSWEGTPFSNFGDALEAAMVLTCTAPGMPLIYSGQEAGLDRPLAFFDKDSIPWQEHKFFGFYQSLLQLKKDNKALWNGAWGGTLEHVSTTAPDRVFAFYREKDGHKVLVTLNLSPEPQKFQVKADLAWDSYQTLFGQGRADIDQDASIELPSWGYEVFHLE